MSSVFVGRQPIYDRHQAVYAYELLYRAGPDNHCPHDAAEAATAQVILNSLVEIGLDRLVGGGLGFINVTGPFLCGEPVPLPRERMALEVLEGVEVDEALLEALGGYVRAGYTIALDDFVLSEENRALLELAHIVKLDVLNADVEDLRQRIAALKPHGVKLLAEKVETHEVHRQCLDLGFDYFQGFFFCRPQVVAGHGLPANRLTAMQLLAELQDPHVTVEQLETLVRRDPVLSYRLLRYVNSAFFALPRHVDSIRQAVIYLGQRAIRTWATLLTLAAIDDKPHELVTTALVRARMCEQLAGDDSETAQSAFVVGLFSILDAMMDAPLATIVESLPLTSEVAAALLDREGRLGALLDCTVAYERGDWTAMTPPAGIDAVAVRDAYLDAVQWADAVSRGLMQSHD